MWGAGTAPSDGPAGSATGGGNGGSGSGGSLSWPKLNANPDESATGAVNASAIEAAETAFQSWRQTAALDRSKLLR